MNVNLYTDDSMLSIERDLWEQGYQSLAGVDEAGRGCLAGPVVVAAVILAHGDDLEGIVDSKLLTAPQRQEVYERILQSNGIYSIYAMSCSAIDRLNILQATLQAMKQAVKRLTQTPDYILIDGNRLPPGLEIPARAIVGGDRKSRSIAAASILAKVTRDRILISLDKRYPDYGFAVHKGYATQKHLASIRTFGPCPHHRYSYKPVSQTQLNLDYEPPSKG